MTCRPRAHGTLGTRAAFQFAWSRRFQRTAINIGEVCFAACSIVCRWLFVRWRCVWPLVMAALYDTVSPDTRRSFSRSARRGTRVDRGRFASGLCASGLRGGDDRRRPRQCVFVGHPAICPGITWALGPGFAGIGLGCHAPHPLGQVSRHLPTASGQPPLSDATAR